MIKFEITLFSFNVYVCIFEPFNNNSFLLYQITTVSIFFIAYLMEKSMKIAIIQNSVIFRVKKVSSFFVCF